MIMRILLVVTLLLVSITAQAKKYDVKCYSNNALILSKEVDDVSQLDGLLILKDGTHITFTNGNCVIEYVKPIYKK